MAERQQMATQLLERLEEADPSGAIFTPEQWDRILEMIGTILPIILNLFMRKK